jgi:hypothetical protein
VKKLVDQKATASNIKKPVLDDGERQRLANQLLMGELVAREAQLLKLFTDVKGRHWSAEQLVNLEMAKRMTVAEQGDHRGDILMQSKVMFVMAQETLDRFTCVDLPSLIKVIKQTGVGIWWQCQAIDFNEASKGMHVSYSMIPQNKWTAREKVFLDLVKAYDMSILFTLSGNSYNQATKFRRNLVIGESDTALAWTDGKSYIAFSRHFLKTVEFNMLGMMNLFDVVLHEYCHDDVDSGSHNHTAEFYQKYHDTWMQKNQAAAHAFDNLHRVLESYGNRLTRILLKAQDQVMRVKKVVEANPKLVEVTKGEKSTPVESIPIRKHVAASNPVRDMTDQGGNPYRASSNYGILFGIANQKYWDKQELLNAVSSATDKATNLVVNDLAVLSNPNHKSNGNRSQISKDTSGNMMIVRCV